MGVGSTEKQVTATKSLTGQAYGNEENQQISHLGYDMSPSQVLGFLSWKRRLVNPSFRMTWTSGGTQSLD